MLPCITSHAHTLQSACTSTTLFSRSPGRYVGIAAHLCRDLRSLRGLARVALPPALGSPGACAIPLQVGSALSRQHRPQTRKNNIGSRLGHPRLQQQKVGKLFVACYVI